MNRNLHPFTQRIYHAGTNTVQTAAGLIAALRAEFTTGMQYRINDLHSGNTAGMHIHRHTPSFILHADHVVFFYRYADCIPMTVQCLVNRVVYDLPNQMVQASGICGADIHTRSFSYSIKAVKNLYTASIICIFCHTITSFYFAVVDLINSPLCSVYQI